jgi:hypothetical protein
MKKKILFVLSLFMATMSYLNPGGGTFCRSRMV